MKKGQTKHEYQTNPKVLETSKVQLWSSDGIMLTLIPLEEAKSYVAEEKAFVSTVQAIVFYDYE